MRKRNQYARYLPGLNLVNIKGYADEKSLLFTLKKVNLTEGNVAITQYNIATTAPAANTLAVISGGETGGVIQVSPDGKLLAVAVGKGKPLGWFEVTAEGAEINIFELDKDFINAANRKTISITDPLAVSSMDFSKDGKYIYYTTISPTVGNTVKRLKPVIFLPGGKLMLNIENQNHAINGNVYWEDFKSFSYFLIDEKGNLLNKGKIEKNQLYSNTINSGHFHFLSFKAFTTDQYIYYIYKSTSKPVMLTAVDFTGKKVIADRPLDDGFKFLNTKRVSMLDEKTFLLIGNNEDESRFVSVSLD